MFTETLKLRRGDRDQRGSLHRGAQQGEHPPARPHRSAARLGPDGERAPRLRARRARRRRRSSTRRSPPSSRPARAASVEPRRRHRREAAARAVRPGRARRRAREPALERLQVRRRSREDPRSPRLDAKRAALITVRDNGKGIARDGAQADLREVLPGRRPPGSAAGGLGARPVDRASTSSGRTGGKILVDSEPGQGQHVHPRAPAPEHARGERRATRERGRARAAAAHKDASITAPTRARRRSAAAAGQDMNVLEDLLSMTRTLRHRRGPSCSWRTTPASRWVSR